MAASMTELLPACASGACPIPHNQDHSECKYWVITSWVINGHPIMDHSEYEYWVITPWVSNGHLSCSST